MSPHCLILPIVCLTVCLPMMSNGNFVFQQVCYTCDTTDPDSANPIRHEQCSTVNGLTNRVAMFSPDYAYCTSWLKMENNVPVLTRDYFRAKPIKSLTSKDNVCAEGAKDAKTIYCYTCATDLCNNGPMWRPGEVFDGLYDEGVLGIKADDRCSGGAMAEVGQVTVAVCIFAVIKTSVFY